MKWSQRGFSLIESLVAVGLVGLAVMTVASLLSSQNASLRYFSQKSETIDIRMQMAHVLANPDRCACQLNPDLTVDDSNDAALEFNSTVDGSNKTINVLRLRVGCALNAPVVAENNMVLSPDLQVSSVQFADLRPTGNPNEWEGVWRVSFTSVNERISVRPAEYKQVVTVAPTVPPNVKVVNCKGPTGTGILASCPPTMFMVGPANGIGAYCIDRTRRPNATFMAAKLTCANLGPGYGPGHLCNHNEWFAGCINGAFTDGVAGGAGESISDFDGDEWLTTARDADCRGFLYRRTSETGPYRCCL